MRPVVKRGYNKTFIVVLLLAVVSVAAACFSRPVFAQNPAVWSGSEEEIQKYVDSFGKTADSVSKKKAKAEKARVDGQTKGEASQEDYVYGSGDILSSWFLTGVWGPETNGLELKGAREAEQVLGQGVVPSLSSYIAYMYQKPASTQTYLADVFQSAKIIPQAQAQGLGFASLNPVLSTWKAFRNLAYLFFVVIFLVIGFMIMFRQKIGGQTIITVQQAIPNIIVALLFVTFSYAIGGLLIDFMYIVMYLITGIFKGSASLMNKNFLEVGAELIKAGFTQGSNVGADTINVILETTGVGDVLDWISGLTVGVIVSLAVLFGVFKLFFEVLKSYVSIILLIVFSPLILMIGAIPGQNTFASWIKNLVGNLSIFPVILLMLIIKNQISTMGGDSGGFMPPYLISQGFGAGLSAIVGIGVLLAIPEIAKKIKEMLGAKEGMLGELAGAAWGRFSKSAGIAAAPTVGAQLGLAGGVVGGLGGAARGVLMGQDIKHVGTRAWESAKQGAMIGAGAPFAARYAIPAGKSALSGLQTQFEQVAGEKLLGGWVRKKEGKEAEMTQQTLRKLALELHKYAEETKNQDSTTYEEPDDNVEVKPGKGISGSI